MTRKKFIIAIYVLTVLVTLFNTVFFFKDELFFNMRDLPKGEFLYSSMSPDGEKTLSIYRVDSSIGSAIRGELITWDQELKPKQSNIFWDTFSDNALVCWNSDNIISINGIELDIDLDETYDSRRIKTISQAV